jgi:hypothetical protein
MHRVNELRVVGIRFDLSAETGDCVIHGTSTRHVRKAPHLSQQLIAMHDLLLPLGQILQQLELPVSQVYSVHSMSSAHGLKVDQDLTELERVDRRPGAPEDDSNSCDQFLEVKGLGDVIVSPQIQALQSIRLLSFGGEHDD